MPDEEFDELRRAAARQGTTVSEWCARPCAALTGRTQPAMSNASWPPSGPRDSTQRIVLGGLRLSARDAVHLAVMEQAGIRRIMSFDSGFDAYPGIAYPGIQRLS